MTLEANKRLVRLYYEDFGSQGRLELADEIFAPGFRMFPDSNPPYGPEGAKLFMAWIRGQYDGLTATIESLVAEGDHVAALVTLRGLNNVPIDFLPDFGHIPATGKEVAWPEYVLWRITDGRIAERTLIIDVTPMLRQVGVLPLKR